MTGAYLKHPRTIRLTLKLPLTPDILIRREGVLINTDRPDVGLTPRAASQQRESNADRDGYNQSTDGQPLRRSTPYGGQPLLIVRSSGEASDH